MRPGIKFCGMTREEDIRSAETLGTDYVGFVFVPSSPRSVTLEEAMTLRRCAKRAKVVGVFMDQESAEINRYADALRLDFIQLHGTPNIRLVTSCVRPVIQAFRGVPDTETALTFLKCCPYILIDKSAAEDTVNLGAVAALPSAVRNKLFLAGGLRPDTVAQASTMVRPFALDCARGVESAPGEKSVTLMTAFIHSVPS